MLNAAPTRCALCLRERPLCNSHLIPKAAYRLIRKLSGASPVLITGKLVSQTDQQIHHHLLCEECEQRFAVGERYALSQCDRGRRFRLQEQIRNLKPLAEGRDPNVYATAGASSLDVPLLTYFASSLLWRASVEVWRLWGQTMTLNLGPTYNEEFRRYLLGETEFPAAAAIWISVASEDNPPFVCVGPHLSSKTTYYQYEMQIFGIRWSMFIGREIDARVQRMCSFRSPERFVYESSTLEKLAVQGVGNLMATAQIAQNLR